jgi:7-cyano-7-deazaguanine tRNA-ribosyltransferase
MPKGIREEILARHNLYTCLSEIQRIKQAIAEGRLWELLELKARSHPYLLEALRKLRDYKDLLERKTPITKERGIFYFGATGLSRPEVVRHQRRIRLHYEKPVRARILVLLPQTSEKPFHRARGVKKLFKRLEGIVKDLSLMHICFYAAPFGIIPIEIDEVYPLSQFEAIFLDEETKHYVAKEVDDFIRRQKYDGVILHNDENYWGDVISNTCKKTCQDLGINFIESTEREPWSKEAIDNLLRILRSWLGRE